MLKVSSLAATWLVSKLSLEELKWLVVQLTLLEMIRHWNLATLREYKREKLRNYQQKGKEYFACCICGAWHEDTYREALCHVTLYASSISRIPQL